MTTKTTIHCDACPAEYPLADSNKYIRLWDKSQFDLCEKCYERLMGYIRQTFRPGGGERTIVYRGSVTDLATDVAFEITPTQAGELIEELDRFLLHEPDKFKKTSG